MSIPPLVCSTPPPPEQCEDDKDHEDFDISYNLSQEDDEDSSNYNYGNYSSYNIYETKTGTVEKEKWSPNLSDVLVNDEDKMKSDEQFNNVNFISNNDLVKESITKLEDNVVEDLNLIVNKDIVHSNDIGSKENDTDDHADGECSDKHKGIQDEGGTDISINDENTGIDESTVINNINIPNENKKLDNKNEDIITSIIEETTHHIDKFSIANDLPDRTIATDKNICTDQVVNTLVADIPEVVAESLTDNDFGDYEDFQFTGSEHSQVLTVNSENPWENDCSESSEFNAFTANFDIKKPKSLENIADAISCKETQDNVNSPLEDGDDFGDFDDFRSSENTVEITSTKEVTSTPDVPIWNLHSPDNDLQVVDSINSVLTSIFVETIPEPENQLLGKLESYLSETWGHLIDIDVRQPYMINWNNSLGQKTLLKALSIDSRNILFGPKWNYNTPKYAVNLTAVPLQPQKQFASHNSSTETSEKVSNKETGTWVDPFTPDGQEYTYAEALLLDLEHLMATLDQMAHKHSTVKISELLSHACSTGNENVETEPAKRPTELDVFESDAATNLNKIYSSTINVQPLRHINLPDTHIFTPTDSETPRSKTIHYDSGPSALIPQPAQENKSQSNSLPAQTSDVDDKEYWDFQDFKASDTAISPVNTVTQTMEKAIANPTSENVIASASVSYQTQMLQPIRLEPIMPTLNWPDPGEVKETFDDFSDFISSTSWNNEKENQGVGPLDVQHSNQNLEISKEVLETKNVDDEFETFQSAPSMSSAAEHSLSSTVGSQILTTENVSMKNVENCDNSPVKVEIKTPPFNNVRGTQNASVSNISDIQDFTFPRPIPGNQHSVDILQPTSASSSGSSRQQHRSDQILQPLSLESYSQINWPNPGIDLQDLSRFNPINSLHSLKSDTSTSGNSKNASPSHNSVSVSSNQTDDDIWGDFVSSAPKQPPTTPKKAPTFADDDEWTDFVSSPSIKPQNGLNTISFNVHTNLSMQKPLSRNKLGPRSNQMPLDIPTLNYITPKSSNRGIYSEKHFQNL